MIVVGSRSRSLWQSWCPSPTVRPVPYRSLRSDHPTAGPLVPDCAWTWPPRLLAYLLFAKYGLHLPLIRQTTVTNAKASTSMYRRSAVQIGRQEPDDIVVAEFLRPAEQRAVARDLVMLDRLRVGDSRGIKHAFVLHLARGFVRFLDQAVDRRARLSSVPSAATFPGVADIHISRLLPAASLVGSTRENSSSFLPRLAAPEISGCCLHIGRIFRNPMMGISIAAARKSPGHAQAPDRPIRDYCVPSAGAT